jgi:DNA helicase II / ATP-dependent DNA helicase PcrA
MTKLKSTPDFEKALHELNTEQLLAVNSIEGPLLVIAGPGTGKTQILAVRIGNILLQTDTDPRSILCLTYTESGATNMRQRLIKFIGPTAYEVSISTFHSFCNAVIRENPDVFDQYSDYELISDLERVQLLLKLLDNLDPTDVLYKYHGKYDHEFHNFNDLFSKIKKENWNPDQILKDIEKHLEEKKTDDDMIYKRKTGDFNPGDLKINAYRDYCRKYDRSRSAIHLYTKYQELLDSMSRFEYEDMIQWVIRKFETNENLLAKYQERYQYILVDEYQDTNGAQNKILFQLLSFFESANVFAVGDDDQAIFRFQGANVQNMIDFDKTYQPEKIVLVNNYRSSQNILDVAESVIHNNRERLVNKDETLSKILFAASINKNYTQRPVFIEYEHQQAEVLDIANQIEALIKKGTEPKQIAVLFKKNAESEPFIKLFEARNIPYQTSRQINILDELIVRHVFNILQFIAKEYKQSYEHESLLYKIMHAPFIDIPIDDISKMAWYLQNKRKNDSEEKEITPEHSLHEMLSNESELIKAGVHQINTCIAFSKTLKSLRTKILDLTPQGMFEKILQEFGILNYILNHKEKIQWLHVINSYFEFLKNETRKNASLGLVEFVELIEEYIKNNIVIPNTQFIGSQTGVVLSTIHSAKGMEYEYVFMINNSDRSWKTRSQSGFALPPSYIDSEINSDEDNRRLFYVGLTRAKSGLQVSFNVGTGKKPDTMCRFISEMLHSDIPEKRVYKAEEQDLIDQLIVDLSPLKKKYEVLEDQLFEKFIDKFRLNPTALTKFLHCPLSFYYEKVLQVPGARTAALGFGNAVHFALELYMRNPVNLRNKNYNLVQDYFKKGMDKFKSHFTKLEFDQYLNEGLSVLPGFIQHFATDWNLDIDPVVERKINTELNGIPISGKMDRIDITEDGVRVVDYKTGAPNISKKIKGPGGDNPYGTDYWIQMVFYAILLKHQKPVIYPSASGKFKSAFYFVNPDKNKEYIMKEVTPVTDEIERIEDLIQSTYQKILKREFTPGCGKPTCDWCAYVNSGVPISLFDMEEDQDED